MRSSRTNALILFSAAMCAVAVACSDDPLNPDSAAGDPASIQLPGNAVGLYPGESVVIVPVVLDSAGRKLAAVDVIWTVSDTSVIRVDPSGTVRAVAQGTALLSIEAGSVSETVPVRVTRFTQISGIQRDFCALDLEGVAWCRGVSWGGVLGPETLSRDVFRQMQVGLRFSSITVGHYHACGLADGRAYCWGDNHEGPLGRDGFDADGLPPDTVSGGHAFVSITAGYEHTCALDTDGVVWCWGRPHEGQLGRGQASPTYRNVPAPVDGDHEWTLVDAGWENTCGVATDGLTYCWGALNGEWSPAPVANMPSGAHVLSGDGVIACAGTGPLVYCRSGVAWRPDVSFTGLVTLPGPVTDLSSYGQHACAIIDGGELYCWGPEAGVMLGNGSTAGSSEPVQVMPGEHFTDVISGGTRTCALTEEGAVYCWGGDVWDGSGIPSAFPVRIGAPLP
ncbi:MAG TPA: hypothetical protein VF039_03500 [Longimicrobiales bacterium]